ncbi:MAG: response regulator [Campylobacteraceae bacterium]|nr:response regulator [Campylobacteraceae bacterium]
MKRINTKGTVLIYNKDTSLFEKTSSYLENKGFNVYAVSSYDTAIKKFNEYFEDLVLVIIDTNLADDDVEIKFVKEIRSMTKELPIYILRTYYQLDFVKNLISLNINGYITKPFTYELLFYEIEKILTSESRYNIIERAIKFPPEHLSSGSSILQYFGRLLQEKYPNEEVKISLKQEGLKVTMTIETPEGKKEEVEEYLDRYGMVVTKKITPQEFTSNPIQVLELETKLDQAEQEIKFQKKLLNLKDKTYDENLTSLKDEVKFLRNELSALRSSNNENIQLILSSLIKKDKLINKLTKSIEKRDDKKTEQLLLELREKDSQGYISLKEHMENAIIGGIVNAPSWIQFLMPIIP